MAYTIVLTRSAERELKALPPTVARRVGERLRMLTSVPRPAQAIRLKGTENYRIRIGD